MSTRLQGVLAVHGGRMADYKTPHLQQKAGLPIIAIPTTAGTGSETTGVAIFDYIQKRAKTGIAHRYLKPTLGIVDAANTRTIPPAVAAASGLDVLSHALESYTALPYTQHARSPKGVARSLSQGANPYSDVGCIGALPCRFGSAKLDLPSPP